MKHFTLLFLVLFSSIAFSQTQTDSIIKMIKGRVVDSETKLPMGNVHVINATKIKGTVTNGNGLFEIEGTVNDTLLFTYIGFNSTKVTITNDWKKTDDTKVEMTEKIFDLDEVVITQLHLTGYLEVDTKLIAVDDSYRVQISGLPIGYEAGEKSPNAINRVLSSIFNPADFLHNTFSKKAKEMKKLREMKKDNTVRDLLASKFDRETIATLLEIDKDDIPMILQKCNYSESFIKTANDLQILDAISTCYEDYKVLKK